MIELETKFLNQDSNECCRRCLDKTMLLSSKQTDFFYTTILLNTRGSNAHAPPSGEYDTKVTAKTVTNVTLSINKRVKEILMRS